MAYIGKLFKSHKAMPKLVINPRINIPNVQPNSLITIPVFPLPPPPTHFDATPRNHPSLIRVLIGLAVRRLRE